jgi:hypothetical protein
VNFFQTVKSAPVVFFTTPDVEADLRSRVSLDHVKVVHFPLEEFTAFKQWGREFWDRQYARDVFRTHSADLGAVWYEKKEFVLRAADIMPAEVYIWCDAGCIRGEKEIAAARGFGTRALDQLRNGKMHIEQIAPLVKRDFYHHKDLFGKKFIAGGILAGTLPAWRSFKRVYDEALASYDEAGVSGIDDQYIIGTARDRHPELFRMWDQPVKIDRWVKFLELL